MKHGTISDLWRRLKCRVSSKRRQPELTEQVVKSWVPPYDPLPLHGECGTGEMPLIVFDTPPKPPSDPEHNANLTISRLPSNILADIFLWGSEDSFADYSWIACSYVCLYWRWIALDTPRLWGHIVFKSRAWVSACLERSKSSFLIIEANIGRHLDETLVCDVLAKTERIARIHLAISFHTQRLLDMLCGPFPYLTDLSIENHTTFWYLPRLPTQLICLEIYCGGWAYIPWESFALALGQLQQLSELKLSGFTSPPLSQIQPISLPILRNLHLSGSPKHCTQFIEALDSPKLRRLNIHLNDTEDLPALYHAFSACMPKPPKTIMIDREDGISAGGNDLLISATPASNAETASIAFLYKNEPLPLDVPIDACLSWILPAARSDLALAKIFAALPALAGLEYLEHLNIRNWNTVPVVLWQPFLERLKRLQVIGAVGSPPAGLFWALLHDLESTPESTLLPALRKIKMIELYCSAGSWLPQLRQNSSIDFPTNTYFDLDNTRFLDLLVCYLELRPKPLEGLLIWKCFDYTGSEVKLLRRLVKSVVWDGWGMMDGVYSANGDEAGALTINHHSIAKQKGYEELNPYASHETRWEGDGEFLWVVRPSTSMSDRLYVAD